MLVVLVDVAELDGDDDGAVGLGSLVTIVGGSSDAVTGDAEVRVAIEGVAIAETDVEIPMFGDGTVIVEDDAQVETNTIVVVVLAVEETIGEEACVRIGGEAGLAAPLSVVFLTFCLLGSFLLGSLAFVLGLDLLAFLTVLLFLQSLLSLFLLFLG